MANHLLDGYLAPQLIPLIMGLNVIKSYKIDKLNLLYATVAFGTILSSISSLLQYRINRFTKSRSKLTLLTATLLTLSSIVAIIGFSIIRINDQFYERQKYKLPVNLRNKIPSSNADVFTYHFFADIIPGFIILLQTQLCTFIQHDLLFKAKRTFTVGESSIIAQISSAAFLIFAMITYSRFTEAGPFEVNLPIELLLNIGFILFAFVFLPSYLFMNQRTHTIKKYSLIVTCILASYFRVNHLINLKHNTSPIYWLVNYIFSTHQRISLFSLWLSTLTACVSFSTTWSRMVGTTNSLVRKIFHFAIGIVFISGYNQDIDFTRFAAGGMLIIMILLEMIRAWQLKPIGYHLEKVCQALRGKWDNKYLTLSHVYLLVGSFLPLWILPNDSKITNKLLLSTGLISVGVGDTAAAIVGTFMGKTKFKGKSGKTLEGLIGNIIAMILFKMIWIGYTDFIEDFSFVIATVLTALVEAITDNCDNLILPLVMILFLEIF